MIVRNALSDEGMDILIRNTLCMSKTAPINGISVCLSQNRLLSA